MSPVGADRARVTVVHLGRAGDHPGGMTQVVNGYLGWDFANVDVSVLTSRGAPHRHLQALRAAIGAGWAVLTRLDPARTVLVAHLSERGSFVREGLLLRLANRRGIPTVAHLHGSEFAAFAGRFPGLVSRVLRASRRIISLSDESSAIAARLAPGVPVELVPNAVPPGDPVDPEPTVVFGGIVSTRKGVDVLQTAWRALGEDTAGWTLVVAGPVGEPGIVESGVPRIEFLGPIAHRDLMHLLDRAGVAVLPSRDEAMPMFLLEAMARDTCVISTTVGGIPALLSDGAGMLVPPGDAAALTAALRTALTDGAERAATAARARARFDAEFSAETVYPRVEALWLAARGNALPPALVTAGHPRVT